MKTSFKVFLACAFGAIIGLIAALSISDSSFFACLIGMALGGLFGYLAYDFKQVKAAVKAAWKQIISFKFNKENWRGRFLELLACHNMVLSMIIGIWILFAAILLIIGAITNTAPKIASLTITVFVVFYPLGFVFTSIFMILAQQKTEGSSFFGKAEHQDISREFIKRFNPFRFYILSFPKLFTKWIPRAAVKVAKFFAIIFKFVKKVFVLIHSDERLICMSYAAAGVLIGYIIPGGSALKLFIGAVVGGLTGFGAYELLFKKKPEEAKKQEA
ncbi:hypothetical protein JXB28_00410 [Candidatus Woesearchaeota archaeon]|nr:hypothetical protein [Candidatus Woesearchaeota archaeon]